MDMQNQNAWGKLALIKVSSIFLEELSDYDNMVDEY